MKNFIHKIKFLNADWSIKKKELLHKFPKSKRLHPQPSPIRLNAIMGYPSIPQDIPMFLMKAITKMPIFKCWKIFVPPYGKCTALLT